jgi:hypothetical protein
MVKVILANEINLRDPKTHFHLQRNDRNNFFTEWQINLPTLTESEQQALQEIKTDYLHLSEYSLLELIVKMVVLSPLLRLAGFYRPPFYLGAEQSIEVVSQDEDTVVRGRLDPLVFTPQFWVLVIEAKRTQYSLEVGIPQVLSYMLKQLPTNFPIFGLVTNGREFQFLKVTQEESPQYALSDLFSLYRGNDLAWVLQILKGLAQIVSTRNHQEV